jgi:hypothetical protein
LSLDVGAKDFEGSSFNWLSSRCCLSRLWVLIELRLSFFQFLQCFLVFHYRRMLMVGNRMFL